MRFPIPAVAVLMLAACAPQPVMTPPPPPPPMAAAPAAMMAPAHPVETALGPVLADARGMTLYTFDKDAPGRSNCNGKCAVNWPPLTATPGARPEGPWSIVTRADGSPMWAYKGRPVYTWIKDKKPGDTTGEGVGKVWHVARP
jgi:predicted lipoprotein with Yx(FWY)xxD motif